MENKQSLLVFASFSNNIIVIGRRWRPCYSFILTAAKSHWILYSIVQQAAVQKL